MIDHYIDIKFEINRSVYNNMSRFVTSLHISQVNQSHEKLGFDKDVKISNDYQYPVGISFPNINPKGLGDCIRLHGSLDELKLLMKTGNWVSYGGDFKVENLKQIPDTCKYRSFNRVQLETDKKIDKRRIRVMKKFGASFIEACEQYPYKTTNLPFLNIISNTTKCNFPLFINCSDIFDEYKYNGFSSYGLSKSSTIPWF